MDQPAKPISTGPGWNFPRYALLLGLSIFLVFPRPLLGLHSFFYRDYGVLGYPFVYFFRQSFWRGEVPLWNPFSNCGAPFLAQWGTMACYPFSLVYLILPLPWSLSIFTLGHLFLAGAGMFLLARHWLTNEFGAVVAGLGFVWSGATISSLIWPNYLAVLGWMPWVLLAVSRAWREGGKWIALASLAGTMQMLTGVPEVVLFTWLIALTLLALELIAARQARIRMVTRVGTIILLVTALSAVQLLPFLDLLRHSQRTAGFTTGKWAMPPWGWGNLLVPLFHYFYTPQGTIFQAGQAFLTSYFPGIGFLALALIAMGTSRERLVWALALLTLFGLIMALGDSGVLYAWLKPLIPLLGVARYPIKFVFIAAFCIPLLAAAALRRRNGTPPIRPTDAQLWVLGAVLTAAVAVILWAARSFPLPYDRWNPTRLSGLLRLGSLALTLLLFRRWQRDPDRSFATEVALLAVLLADLLLHTATLNPTLPAAAFSPNQVKQVLNLQPEASLGGPRVMISPRAEQALLNSGEPDPLKDFLGKRRGLWSNLNLLDDCPKVNGSSTLQLREQKEVEALLYDSPERELPALADFLAAGHVTSSTSAVHWTSRPTWLPIVTAGAKPLFADARPTLAAISAPEFNPRREVYLPLEAKASITVQSASEAVVRVTSFQTKKIQIETEAPEPALVVVAQSFYHPWKATVDGQPVPIWRANHAFQAFQVPAGKARVTLAYRDTSFHAGAIISGLTLLGLAAGYRRLRSNPIPAS